MNRFTFSALLAATTLTVTVFAQSTPALDQPNPPAPPRPDAPGTPINPEQTTPAAAAPVDQSIPAAAAPASAAPAAAPAEPTAPVATPVRELVFADADGDKDARVSLNEYVTFVESRLASRSVNPLGDQTIEKFRQLDADNDGFLSQAEATVQQQPPAQVSPGTPPRAGN